DLRIAAYPMTSEVLGIGTPFDPMAGTHSGDVKFNTAQAFGPAGGIDLYTVALHELGHAFGLDHSGDPAAVMYEEYEGARAGLSSGDVDAFQALYGVRPADAYDRRQSNDTPAQATALTTSSAETISADLGTCDVDYYAVHVIGSPGGATIR